MTIPDDDRAEIWADIERTLRGVIEDGLPAELDELDALLLLDLVECRAVMRASITADELAALKAWRLAEGAEEADSI